MTSNPASIMHRRNFMGLAVGGALAATDGAAYLLSDKSNLLRVDLKPSNDDLGHLQPDEKQILFLVSLAPSGTTRSRG